MNSVPSLGVEYQSWRSVGECFHEYRCEAKASCRPGVFLFPHRSDCVIRLVSHYPVA